MRFLQLSNSAFRKRTATRVEARTGASASIAHLASVALHPFDNQPSSRDLEKVVRRLSRQFTRPLRAARTEAEVAETAFSTVQRFYRTAQVFGDASLAAEWRYALEAAAAYRAYVHEVLGNASEIAAELGLPAWPPDPVLDAERVRAANETTQHYEPLTRSDIDRLVAESLVIAMARGDYRFTWGDKPIEDGADPDLDRMRRPTPLYWPIRYRCGRGHRITETLFISERPHNSGIHHGYCEVCHGDDWLDRPVWAYPEWDEPVPPGTEMTKLCPLV